MGINFIITGVSIYPKKKILKNFKFQFNFNEFKKFNFKNLTKNSIYSISKLSNAVK